MLLDLNLPSGMVGQKVDIVRTSPRFQEVVRHASNFKDEFPGLRRNSAPEFAEPRAARPYLDA